MAGLDTQLHSMTKALEAEEEEEEIEEVEEEEKEEEGHSAFQDRLNAIEEIIMRWEEDQSMIWDSRPDEASEYVNAADEARRLIEKLETLHLSKEDQEFKFLHRAYNVLQTAMARLEEEFTNLLIQNWKPFEPFDFVTSSSASYEEENVADESSLASLGDNSVESFQKLEEYILDLIHPDVIPHLRCIANLMFACNYDRECSRAYTIVRRDAIDECCFVLEMDRLSIENVSRMEWSTLNSKIKRWISVVKIFIRRYLASEKWLSDQIFGKGEPISLVCFVDSSKASILQLLDFGEAVSIGPHQPERLFRILDMYEALASLMQDIDALYSDGAGSCVRIECHEVLKGLGDCVKGTFHEFEHAIASAVSQAPFIGGGIHPLTRYVMNYLKTLYDYGETLNLLLKDKEVKDAIKDAILSSPDMNPNTEEDIKTQVSSMAYHFRSVASILESNLADKSKLYEDASLQHLFLMNNIHYMAEMVKGSELRLIYGDEWIRKCYRKYGHHAMNYERTSLSSILSLLKGEGLHMPVTFFLSQSLVKERLRNFYDAFGDLYRVQTAWVVPDAQLREESRISLSLKLIHAYRTFVGRYCRDVSDKHIKYSADDLEIYLLDFFEGAAKSLESPIRGNR